MAWSASPALYISRRRAYSILQDRTSATVVETQEIIADPSSDSDRQYDPFRLEQTMLLLDGSLVNPLALSPAVSSAQDGAYYSICPVARATKAIPAMKATVERNAGIFCLVGS